MGPLPRHSVNTSSLRHLRRRFTSSDLRICTYTLFFIWSLFGEKLRAYRRTHSCITPPVSDLGVPQAAKATTSSASETKDTEKGDCAGAEGLPSFAYMESCRDNLPEGAVLHEDLQPLKRVCSNPVEVPLNVTLTQPAQDGSDRLSLLGLPAGQ
jgi:hypothetical protein